MRAGTPTTTSSEQDLSSSRAICIGPWSSGAGGHIDSNDQRPDSLYSSPQAEEMFGTRIQRREYGDKGG